MDYPQIGVTEKIGFEIVVHSWLKDEWYKPEYNGIANNIHESLIINPNFNSKIDNEKRLSLIKEQRPNMISSHILQADWYKIFIYKRDVERLYHCATSDWNVFSNGTFKIKDTISNIFPKTKIDMAVADKIKEIYSLMKEGSIINGLILVGHSFDSAFTIIEGNHRIIALMAKVKDNSENNLISEIAFLGLNKDMIQYDFHINKYFPEI